ncbi:NAD(P)-dependent oxidoreductase [Eleftheria terrae]|uniref:NAD(P)-dependent oxidoreductase n=1 Tax=Eleftheria terrae TaxID=1597781 RepID=UPI00263B02A1|nr:NAD(P)H-binding protein [Eleftheria terrae]WKB51808.1 NAD(P)H-binding protein [Eleftheria terrae]
MKVLVVGATGGSGRAAVQALLAAGHEVTAFARRPELLPGGGERLALCRGDVMDSADLERAMAGQQAVVVTLGIAENPWRVRLFGSRGTPLDVRSAGTYRLVECMRRHQVRRLVVQTSYGVGETRERLPALYRLMFQLLLKPQVADTERQERVVRDSGLDWVLAQPVNLTDADDPAAAVLASPQGAVRSMRVSRRQVGRFLAEAVQAPQWVGCSVALSG